MAGEQVVFHDGRYNGRTLREWLPELVEAIRETFDPIQIILFGSVAAGREPPLTGNGGSPEPSVIQHPAQCDCGSFHTGGALLVP